jgi:hypothetical protein
LTDAAVDHGGLLLWITAVVIWRIGDPHFGRSPARFTQEGAEPPHRPGLVAAEQVQGALRPRDALIEASEPHGTIRPRRGDGTLVHLADHGQLAPRGVAVSTCISERLALVIRFGRRGLHAGGSR